MQEQAGEVQLTLPIFQHWLAEIGVTKLISSTLADELEKELQRAEDEAFVKAGELEKLAKNWPLYRGREITSEAVRAWLDQAMQAQEQRLLFTVLQHVRFVSTPQIVEKVVNAHDAVVNRLVPRKLRESKLERRRDLWITYVDGPGKSGSQYARTYAKENGILLDCVQEPGRLGKRLAGRQDGTEELPGAIVIVDDLIATGQSLSGRLEGFAGENADLLTRYKIPLIVVALYATQEGQEVLERLVKRLAPIQVILCITEVLGSDAFAFPAGGVGFWCNESERDRARALCTRLGTGLYKHALGFGGQGLLLVFPDTCPNNSLPILFAGRAGANAWNPLFPRPSS